MELRVELKVELELDNKFILVFCKDLLSAHIYVHIRNYYVRMIVCIY